MKKILSLLMVFVAVMAFSGLAMAEPVTAYSIKDRGSKTVTIGDSVKIFTWHLKYYNKKHVRFYFYIKIQKYDPYYGDYNGYYDYDGNWVSTNTLLSTNMVKYTCDYKKVSSHRMKMTVIGYVNGMKIGSGSKYVKTSKTPYKKFKSQKTALINNFVSIPFEDDF